MNGKNEFEHEITADDNMNYSASVPSGWQFSGANLTNESVGFISAGNSSVVRNRELGGVSSCTSTSMANSFSPTLWDHPNNPQNTGFCNFNLENNIGASDIPTVVDKRGQNSLRSSIDLDMDWNQQMKGVFSANVSGMLPASLSQLPTDSAFIERAARFSCFNSGNFGDMVRPFGISESVGVHSMSAAATFLGSRHDLNPRNEALKDASLSMEVDDATEKQGDERESERSQDREKQGRDAEPVKESDEAGISGGDGSGQDEPCTLRFNNVGEPASEGLKKRKRGGQIMELGQSKEATQQIQETLKNANGMLNQRKGDQNASPTTNKPAGKQDSQTSDAPKEDYIHVRARRGQATNSHSLAERVRREKISERMRLLQDLVPGCSKVTGKAVMLDEIINYVQSLQRQVEFLSMKLATVNPRMDFNIEGLLAKDIIQSRAGASSYGFSPELSMPYLPQPPPHHGLVPPGLPNLGSSSDLLRRTISSQLTSLVGGFKEPIQLQNMWEDDIHNVLQMNFDATAPSATQDIDGSIPPCNMKAEN